MQEFKIEAGGEKSAVRVTGEFERWSMDRDELVEAGVDDYSARYVELDFVVAGAPEHVQDVIAVLSPRAVDMDVEVLVDIVEEE